MDEEKKDLSLTEDQAQQMPAETKAAEEVQRKKQSLKKRWKKQRQKKR